MSVLKSLFTFLLFIYAYDMNAQETVKPFRSNLFKYNEDETNFTLGGGPLIGIGTQGLNAGLLAELDVFHILIGYRSIIDGVFFPNDHVQIRDNAVYLGYQYRTKKIMCSAAAGSGSQKIKCTSGMNYDCYDVVEGKFGTIPWKAGIDFLFTPETAIGFSINGAAGGNRNTFQLLAGFKYGLFNEDGLNY